jgi:hypothetical protein
MFSTLQQKLRPTAASAPVFLTQKDVARPTTNYAASKMSLYHDYGSPPAETGVYTCSYAPMEQYCRTSAGAASASVRATSLPYSSTTACCGSPPNTLYSPCRNSPSLPSPPNQKVSSNAPRGGYDGSGYNSQGYNPPQLQSKNQVNRNFSTSEICCSKWYNHGVFFHL